MIRTVSVVVSCLVVMALSPCAQAQQLKSLEELVAEMREREKAASSVYLEMTSKGSYPGNLVFETEGTLRVLQGTHFQMDLVARFDEEIAARSEMVKTPEGVWMREEDPASGEVFLKMDAELVARLSGGEVVTLANSVGGLEGTDDYLKLFEVNLSRLLAALPD